MLGIGQTVVWQCHNWNLGKTNMEGKGRSKRNNNEFSVQEKKV